jgi:Di-haem oxidoreductase, putative peroxidase
MAQGPANHESPVTNHAAASHVSLRGIASSLLDREQFDRVILSGIPPIVPVVVTHQVRRAGGRPVVARGRSGLSIADVAEEYPMARPLLVGAAFSVGMLLTACTDRPTPDTPLGPTVRPPQVAADVGEDVDLTQPLSGLSASELNRFNVGRAVFSRVFDASTGLGPLFNSSSCAGCHEDPSVGGFGDDLTEDVETHVSTVSGTGSCDDLSAHGGFVIQQHTTGLLQDYHPGHTTEPVPAEALGITGRRTTPALFGFGLLEAVPASTLLALADPNDANGDGISGRVQMDGGQPARFGRKATDAGLLGFNAGAFMMEMGITNQFHSDEQPLVGVGFPYDQTIDPVSVLELSNADLALATELSDFCRRRQR